MEPSESCNKGTFWRGRSFRAGRQPITVGLTVTRVGSRRGDCPTRESLETKAVHTMSLGVFWLPSV